MDITDFINKILLSANANNSFKRMKKEIFILFPILILTVLGIILHNYRLFDDLSFPLAQKTLKSHTFIINNNLAQYSSYITKYENSYLIEIYFYMNWNQVLDGSNIELYSCLLQWIDKSAMENIIQVKSTSTSGYYFGSNRMIKFELTKREIRRYLNSNFKIENVQVAIIRKDEFDKNLTEIELNSRLDSIDTSTFQKIVLPFSFIKYQKPYLIDGRRNLTKSIGACIPFS